MKLTSDNVLFINLCFRILIIVSVLKQENVKKPPERKTIRHWLNPISKRVFLILVNGLNEDFLYANSTPYMQKMLDQNGSFAVSLTRYLETNRGGLKSIITGVPGYSPQVPWTEAGGYESLLEYVGCACVMGIQLPDVEIPCYYPYEYPLERFSEFLRLFNVKNQKSCLYVINFDFDPVLAGSYGSRLKKLDDDIKLMATAVDNFWKDNKTTYIVTSARGSPVGHSLSQNAPLLAWGCGIANTSEVINIRPIDIGSMICVLLGTMFPTGMRGIFPIYIMNMSEHHLFEMALYTVRHFESVLEISDSKAYLIESSELKGEQYLKRLYQMASASTKTEFLKCFSLYILVVLTTIIWGLNLLVLSTSGTAYVSLSKKSVLSLVVMVLTTVVYMPYMLGNLIALEVLLWFTFQNVRNIEFGKNFYLWMLTVSATITLIVFVGMFGRNVAVPLFFLPVAFWCVLDRSYRKLNPFVLFTRIASDIALCYLPLSRVFGVLPDFFCLSLICIIFLLYSFLVFNYFNVKMNFHTKINILMVIVTRLYVNHLYQNKNTSLEGVFSSFLLVFAGLSVSLVSGSLLVRLLNIFLALFIPVQMFSVQLEPISYFCIACNMFTWVFAEHRSWARIEGKSHSNVFSLEPVKLSRSIQFSENDKRHLFLFVAYCLLFYLAMGHYPDLHSYDLYVLPAFVYPFTDVVSYSLGVIKFFIPFFVTTASLVTVRSVQGRDFDSLMAIFLWLTDTAGCCLLFCSEVVNEIFKEILPVRFSYFIIQQSAIISIILSYSLSKCLLLRSKRFSWKFFTRRERSGEVGGLEVKNDSSLSGGDSRS